MKYYIPIRKFSLWNKFYMYVDVERYCADTLFAQECVHCHFIEEYGKPDSDVKVIFVRFPKSEEQQFLRAVNRLESSFLLKQIDIDSKLGKLKELFEDYWRDKDDGTGSS